VGSIGTFTYRLPVAAPIEGAILSGAWGTLPYPYSSAGVLLYVDGAYVGSCAPHNPSCWIHGSAPRIFNFPIPSSVFSDLADGNADLSLVQTDEYTIRLGSPTLAILYTPAAVSEPSPPILTFTFVGIVGLLGRRRLHAER